jgi:hypothetical protein
MDEYLETKIKYIHDYLEKNKKDYTIMNYSNYDLNISLRKKNVNIYTINIWWHQSCCRFYKLLDEEVTSVKDALQLIYNLTDIDGNFLHFSKFHTKIFLSEEQRNTYEIDNNVKLSYYLNKKEIPTCCVCLEDTMMKTACKHSLCLDCYSKIVLCPCCRKCLEIDHEEEEDDDDM